MEGPNARALNLAAILPVFSSVALPALHSTRSRDPRAPLKWLLHDSWDLAVKARSVGGSSAGLSALKGPSFTLSAPKGLELSRFFTHGTECGGVIRSGHSWVRTRILVHVMLRKSASQASVFLSC